MHIYVYIYVYLNICAYICRVFLYEYLWFILPPASFECIDLKDRMISKQLKRL
jgi:hypothetical protein